MVVPTGKGGGGRVGGLGRGGKLTGPHGETKSPSTDKPAQTKPTTWVTSDPPAAKLQAKKDELVRALAKRMGVEAPKPAAEPEVAKPAAVVTAPVVESAKPQQNKLTPFVEGKVTDEGPALRVAQTIHGQPVPKGFFKKATEEWLTTTAEVKDNLQNGHAPTNLSEQDRLFANRAFAEAKDAISDHHGGRLGDVIPALSRVESDPDFVVQMSTVKPEVKRFTLSDFATRADRNTARENAQAVVSAVVQSSGRKLMPNGGRTVSEVTLNDHVNMFTFDKDMKVLEWNEAIIFGSPEGFKAPTKPAGAENLGEFDLSGKR